MNEILVEEENTVYELDPECLRHKEEQRQLEEKPGVERSGLEPSDWSDQKIYLPYYQMPRL